MPVVPPSRSRLEALRRARYGTSEFRGSRLEELPDGTGSVGGLSWTLALLAQLHVAAREALPSAVRALQYQTAVDAKRIVGPGSGDSEHDRLALGSTSALTTHRSGSSGCGTRVRVNELFSSWPSARDSHAPRASMAVRLWGWPSSHAPGPPFQPRKASFSAGQCTGAGDRTCGCESDIG